MRCYPICLQVDLQPTIEWISEHFYNAHHKQEQLPKAEKDYARTKRGGVQTISRINHDGDNEDLH